MWVMFTPIDTASVTREALRGFGPEDPPRRTRVKRYRWLRRQPERPRSTPVVPAASRSLASGRSVPSSAR
jgi:hypothetical protein